MRYICHFSIPDFVPENEPIDYHTLAVHSGVDTAQLKQYLRYAMANRIFYEPSTEMVAHTAASLLLREGKQTRPLVQWLTEDCAPMVAHQIDAIEKWGHGSQESNQTAVNHAYGVDGAFYDFLGADPVRERRFGKAISNVYVQPASSVTHIQNAFDWSLLGDGTVVDVGGHIGYCGVAIAEASSKLTVIVQDRPEVVAIAEDPKSSVVPTELQGRVRFQTHDFFTPQQTPADVFFYRKCFLNHTDKNAAKMIEALSPVLKTGNRLLIMDFVQAKKTVETTPQERYYRAVDLQMLLYYNCRYRTLEEWKNLVKNGDSRLEFEGHFMSAGSAMPILSFVVR